MNNKEFTDAMAAMMKELPPNGSAVDLNKIDALFTKHFPDAKTVTPELKGTEKTAQ